MLRRPVAAALLLGAALVPVALPAATGAAPACAAASGPHAGLVIDTGSNDVALCVALDAPSVTGIHLIELAGAQAHLAYGFGSGGQAVCRLAGIGPAGDDCFADYPDFWGYWHGDGRGGWTWSSTGAASASVRDGDLDGWAWGSGDSGTTHAQPPATRIADVCVPPTPAAPTSSSPATPAVQPPTAAPTPSGQGRSPAGGATSKAPRSPTPTGGSARASGDPAPRASSSVAALAALGSPPTSGGPGPGLLLAIGFGAALAGGGWLRLRSRRRARGDEG